MNENLPEASEWHFQAADYQLDSDELHVAILIPYDALAVFSDAVSPSIGETLSGLGSDLDRIRAVVADAFGFVGKKVVVDWHSDHTWDKAKRDKRWMSYSYYEHYYPQ